MWGREGGGRKVFKAKHPNAVSLEYADAATLVSRQSAPYMF